MKVTWKGNRQTGALGCLLALFVIAVWIINAAAAVAASSLAVWLLYHIAVWMVG